MASISIATSKTNSSKSDKESPFEDHIDAATDKDGNPIPFPTCLPMDISNFQNDPAEKLWSGPFTFILAADPQFGLIEKYFLHKENPRWDEEITLTRKAIQMANEMKPKPRFFVVCGDMLDTRPGTEEEQSLRKEQYADFVNVFKDLDPEIKLVCTCGNHDVGDIPTPESVGIYWEQFGPDYFSFWVGGVKFVVLNSQYFKSPETVPEVYKKQSKFIEGIPDARANHLVVMQHIPFFIKDADEDDVIYLNIEKEQRFPVLDKLVRFGVHHIFCGHYHRNAGGTYKDMEQVVTSALGGPLGSDPSGFRIVRVEKDKITHEYVSVIENADSETETTTTVDGAEEQTIVKEGSAETTKVVKKYADDSDGINANANATTATNGSE